MTWAAAGGEGKRKYRGGSQRSLATNTAARRHGIELPGARRNSSTARACRGSAGIKRGGSGCHLDAQEDGDAAQAPSAETRHP